MKRLAYFSFLFLSIAGAFLVGTLYNHHAAAGKGSTGGRRILYYTDPMHPAYKSDKPGIAPDCGMQLEPVYADGGPSGVSEDGALTSAGPGAVKIDVRKQQLSGVRVSPVEKASGEHALRVFGRVAPDEARTYKLNAGIEGYIQEVSAVTTGSQVKKDQLLATFAAPNASMTLQTYLTNLGAEDQFKKSEADGEVDGQNMASVRTSVMQRRQQMQNMGMSLLQIEEIRRTRRYPETIRILAPTDGVVLARMVSPGLRFDRGAEWYRIADLSKVWVMADVFENDAAYLRPGMRARVSLPNQKNSLAARVGEVLPQFDPNSRTLKVRLEVDNPGYALRPDMFVNVELLIAFPPSIVVPVEAVLDSGLKKTVYVDRGEGVFEPRQVETGSTFDGRVQIVAGLEAGERIVTSGNFLLDSESRMKQAAAGPQAEKAQGAEMAAEKTQGKDPVCGMGLSGATEYKGEYAGQHFYFCSKECQHKFEKEPGLYLPKSTGGNQQSGDQHGGNQHSGPGTRS